MSPSLVRLDRAPLPTPGRGLGVGALAVLLALEPEREGAGDGRVPAEHAQAAYLAAKVARNWMT